MLVLLQDSSTAFESHARLFSADSAHTILHGVNTMCTNLQLLLLCAVGAATSDIIEQYVSTIKTLREVDPTGKRDSQQ